ncbi:MAG: hypothetical protein KGD74_12190 [Candidatus Lokiarchaeota archaeon]|nr:hypothetical protein [Candidatus Lokiarchaeota archaeon]
MKKTKQTIIIAVIMTIYLVLLTAFVAFIGSDGIGFPFYIFFPILVAIFVPIITRQRQEAKMKEEIINNQLK